MRWVRYQQQIRDAETGEFIGVLGVAFHLRSDDDGGLSTTWVEHYGLKGFSTYKIAGTRFRDSLESKKLGPKSYFAVGNVGKTKATCSVRSKKIRIVHDPYSTNSGHVQIRQFSDDDIALLEALAEDVFTEHVSVATLGLK